MSKHVEGGQFQPELTPRYEFEFRGEPMALVAMALMQDSAPITAPMKRCDCGDEDCLGWSPIPMDPATGMAVMAAAISSLLDDRDARLAQREPKEN